MIICCSPKSPGPAARNILGDRYDRCAVWPRVSFSTHDHPFDGISKRMVSLTLIRRRLVGDKVPGTRFARRTADPGPARLGVRSTR
jgi:hypothetical protein